VREGKLCFTESVCLTLIIMLGLSRPGLAQAPSCDPLTFKDNTVSFQETWSQLLYNQDVVQHQQGSNNNSFGVGFFDIVILTGQSQSDYLNELQKITNLSFTQSDRRFLYLSKLSPTGVTAYLGCLQSHGSKHFYHPLSYCRDRSGLPGDCASASLPPSCACCDPRDGHNN
jgi:hypothetical protein